MFHSPTENPLSLGYKTLEILIHSGVPTLAVTCIENMFPTTSSAFTNVGYPVVELLSVQSPVSGVVSDVQRAFLISGRTPCLLGEDLLHKLHASSHSTPDELFLTNSHDLLDVSEGCVLLIQLTIEQDDMTCCLTFQLL